jgi:hypothetical protein
MDFLFHRMFLVCAVSLIFAGMPLAINGSLTHVGIYEDFFECVNRECIFFLLFFLFEITRRFSMRLFFLLFFCLFDGRFPCV